MREVTRASDSIWHAAAMEPDEAAEYAELKARRDAHRADAAKLSDHDLQNAYDDLGDDIELDRHNRYDLLGHLLDRTGEFGPEDGPEPLPEKTDAEKAHDDLRSRHIAFGDELDARGLWGPAAELNRQKMLERMNKWPEVVRHQKRLVEDGTLDPDSDIHWGDTDEGFSRYMGYGGFPLAEAKSIAAKYQEERDRRFSKQMVKLFGPAGPNSYHPQLGGFDPTNPEHRAVANQFLNGREGK